MESRRRRAFRRLASNFTLSKYIPSRKNDFKLELVKFNVHCGSVEVTTEVARENDSSFRQVETSD
jgi:hypothetical protein